MSGVRAEVKYVLAIGEGAAEDFSLEGFSPTDPEDFGFDAQVFIGPQGQERFDSFDLLICSPIWLARRWMDRFTYAETGPVEMAPAVCWMPRWNRTEFDDALRSLCDWFSPAPDWDSLADRLGRYLAWEYHYRYDERVNERHGLPAPNSP